MNSFFIEKDLAAYFLSNNAFYREGLQIKHILLIIIAVTAIEYRIKVLCEK